MTTKRRPKDADLEKMRESYAAFAYGIRPDWQPAYFQESLIAPKLERIVLNDPEWRRTIATLPFRYSKTEFCVDTFIPFYLGHHPDHPVILVTYGKDLSNKSGRVIREIMASPEYVEMFPDSALAKHSRAAGEFSTISGGAFYAGSFTTGVNGRGAKLLCVAEGQRVLTKRGLVPIEKVRVGDKVATPWAWRKVLRTMDNGVRPVVKVSYPCGSLRVTNDHEILTPSGWRQAGLLRRGDDVYGVPLQMLPRRVRPEGQAAREETSEVLLPQVLAGLVAGAFREHPSEVRVVRQAAPEPEQFAVLLDGMCVGVPRRDGRSSDLEAGPLRSLRDGVSTAVENDEVLFQRLPRQGADNEQSRGGQPQLPQRGVHGVLPPSLQAEDESGTPGAVEEVHGVLNDRESRLPPLGREQEERCGQEHRGPLPTVPHEVSQVEECGLARVYDLEVEGDHCFIVEGVVVHNCVSDPHKNPIDFASPGYMPKVQAIYDSTVKRRCEPNASIFIESARWTPADLVGWLIDKDGAWDVIRDEPYVDDEDAPPREGKPMWKVIRLQAEAQVDEGWRSAHCDCGLTDDAGTPVEHGEPLWGDHWTCADNQEQKKDPDIWQSSYLLKPTIAGGFLLAKTPPNYFEKFSPQGMNLYLIVDPSRGHGNTSDKTAIGVIAAGEDHNLYLYDLVWGRMDLTERLDHVFRLHRKWRPRTVAYEEFGMMADIDALRKRQDNENYRFPVTELGRAGVWHSKAKPDRIATLKPLAIAGRLWLPKPDGLETPADLGALVKKFVDREWNRYPAVEHDDVLDMLSRINDPDLGLIFPIPQSQQYVKRQRPAGSSWLSW